MAIDQLKEIYFKYKFILWPIFSGIASVVILVLVVIPQFLAYLETHSQMMDLLNQSRMLEAKAEELEKIDDSAALQEIEVVFNMLPQERDVPGISAILKYLIEDKSGLKIKDKSYSTSPAEASKGSFQFKVVVSGKLENLRRFLVEIDNSPKIFQIEALNVRFNKDGDLDADIPIATYFEEAPKQVSVPFDQDVPKLSDSEKKLLGDISKKVRPMNISELPIEQPSGLSESFSAPIREEDYSSVPLGKIDPFE